MANMIDDRRVSNEASNAHMARYAAADTKDIVAHGALGGQLR